MKSVKILEKSGKFPLRNLKENDCKNLIIYLSIGMIHLVMIFSVDLAEALEGLEEWEEVLVICLVECKVA